MLIDVLIGDIFTYPLPVPAKYKNKLLDVALEVLTKTILKNRTIQNLKRNRNIINSPSNNDNYNKNSN